MSAVVFADEAGIVRPGADADEERLGYPFRTAFRRPGPPHTKQNRCDSQRNST
jgi:hypothetical protein